MSFLFIAILLLPFTARADIFSSKGMAVKFYEQYQKSYDEFIANSTNIHSSVKELCKRRWSVISMYFDVKKDSTVILQQHLLYALHLAGSASNLTDVVIAIHMKFRAFMQGHNFLNCALCTDQYVDRANRKLRKACKKLALHLLAFSKLGFEELRDRLAKDYLERDDVKRLEKFIHAMIEFQKDYWWVFKQVKNNDVPAWMAEYNYVRESIEFYKLLTNRETKQYGNVVEKMTTLFEFLKFDDNYEETYAESLFVDFFIAHKIWVVAHKLYKHSCKSKSKVSCCSYTRKGQFNPYTIMSEYETNYVVVTTGLEYLDVKNEFEKVRSNYAFRLNGETRRLEVQKTT